MNKKSKMKLQKYGFLGLFLSGLFLFIISLVYATDFYTQLYTQGAYIREGGVKILEVFYQGDGKEKAGIVTSANDLILYISVLVIIFIVIGKILILDKIRPGLYTYIFSTVSLLLLVVLAVYGVANQVSVKSDYLDLNISQYETFQSSLDPDSAKEYISSSVWAFNLAIMGYILLILSSLFMVVVYTMNFMDDRKEGKNEAK